MEISLAPRYTNCNSLARIARCSNKLLNTRVETIEDIRHRNLIALIRRYPSQRAFCEAVEKDPTQVSQWVTRAPNSKTGTPRSPSSETCREIEDEVGEPRGWMDHDHRRTAAAELPAYHRSIMGMIDQMDETKRKAFQAAGAVFAEPARPKKPSKRRAG